MGYVNADYVKETSTTTGTGTYSLAGASGIFRTFVAGVGTGNYCPYLATDGSNYEIGVGLVTDATPDTLARTSVLKSSNGDAAVNWGAGTRTISCVPLGDVGSNRKLGHVVLGSAGATCGPIIVPVGVTKLWGHCFVIAPGALVPRILVGGASIDTTNTNYSSGNALPNANQVSQAGTANGWTMCVAAMANTNKLMVRFDIVKQAAAEVARAVWQGCGMVATNAAPTLNIGGGVWVNAADLIQRIELHGYTTLTSAVDANMGAGTELTVYGSYEP